tara:strand:+ start:380 stop:676 length:297 start_codon:yes stop_codon:yes gene_type:complete
MIKLNGQQFALNNKEFINSLFNTGSTCVGYYKPLKNQIKLMDMQKVKVGVITKHKVLALATKRPEGWWYSYGTIDLIGEYDYGQQTRDIEQALKHLKA